MSSGRCRRPGCATSSRCAATRQGGPGQPWVRHPEGVDHADELVSLVRSLGDFTVGVAAFPDQHPESPSLDFDAEVLVRKADAGASTRSPSSSSPREAYVGLRDRVAARGGTCRSSPASCR